MLSNRESDIGEDYLIQQLSLRNDSEVQRQNSKLMQDASYKLFFEPEAAEEEKKLESSMA